MIGMYAKREGMEVAYPPPGTAGTALTPGASWAWSAWVQLDSSLDDDFVMMGVSLWEAISYSTGGNVLEGSKIQVGVGAAGAEVAVATVAGGLAATADALCTHSKTVFKGGVAWTPPTRINRGERVAIRASKSSTGAYILAVKIYGYSPRDMPPLIEVPRSDLWARNMMPNLEAEAFSGGTSLSLTTGTASATYGAWVEAIAENALPRPALMTGVSFEYGSASAYLECQIGTGSVNKEVGRGMVVSATRTALPGPATGAMYLPRPVLVYANERVALRMRGSPTSTAFSVVPIWMEI